MTPYGTKRILLTGGTGFFGKSILDMMRRNRLPPMNLTVLARHPERLHQECPDLGQLPDVDFLAGDVRDFAFPRGYYDCIIHAATPAMALPPGQARDIILKGTERVLAFARRCGATRLLFTSSGAVYGTQPPDLEKIPEDFPCHPVTEYGIAKLEAEQMCVASTVPTVIARCFAFCGPYLNRNIHFAIGNFIRDALANQPIVINGDGTPYRSYLFADDLVEWLFTLLERGQANTSYNVGSDEALSIAQLARMVKENLDSPSPIVIGKIPVPGQPPQRYVPDVSRCQFLGLTQRVSLQEAIRRCGDHDKNTPYTI